MSDRSRVVAVIPARGGSRGIPRKNARLLAGLPLLSYAIRSAAEAEGIDQVFVSTDAEELMEIAVRFGAGVLERPAALAEDRITLDEVLVAVGRDLEARGVPFDVMVTIQPTSPLLTPASLDRALRLHRDGAYDTVLSVVDDRHLAWQRDDNGEFVPTYAERVNRQLLPPHYRETGGVVVTSREVLETGTRFGRRMGVLELPKREAIDIDDHFDWWLAEKSLERRRICFHVIGSRAVGLGHVHRALTLADRLVDHDVSFLVNEEQDLAARSIERRFYPLRRVPVGAELEALVATRPDLVVNDVLDTDEAFMKGLQEAGIRTVNLEDLGPGRARADFVVNALYEHGGDEAAERVYTGASFCCLRDEFFTLEPQALRDRVERILVLFGGTDPNDLTRRVLGWVCEQVDPRQVTAVLGFGYPDAEVVRAEWEGRGVEVVIDTTVISRYMARADLAVTSAGRTVFEIASLGVPMLVIAQNEREERHAFARSSPGLVYLGRASEVSAEVFRKVFAEVAGSPLLRSRMRQALLSEDVREGAERVLAVIRRALHAGRGGARA